MEPLGDPLKDRQVKTLKAPPHKPLDKALLWPEKLKSNISFFTTVCHFS
jgi:serine/threonine-protein phosphatase 2B catalytic subunit